MRLIDADEFAIEEPKLWDWSSVDGVSSTAVLKQCIWDVQCAPTVEAIPISFLKDKIALCESWGCYGYAKGLQSAIDEWEWEKQHEKE